MINNYQSACPILPFVGGFCKLAYTSCVQKCREQDFNLMRRCNNYIFSDRKMLVLRSYLSQKTYFGKIVPYFLLAEGGSIATRRKSQTP